MTNDICIFKNVLNPILFSWSLKGMNIIYLLFIVCYKYKVETRRNFPVDLEGMNYFCYVIIF